MKNSILKSVITMVAISAMLLFNSCNEEVTPLGVNTNQKIFDIDLFSSFINDGMGKEWAGFAYVINKDGISSRDGQYGERLNGSDGDVSASIEAPIYAASLNKTMTAAAMLRVLEDVSNGDVALFLNAKIFQYLPDNWQFGPGINNITFRDLMQHKSGFSTTGPTSYAGIRTAVATGVAGNPNGYSNTNYAMMRILIAIMSDNVDMALKNDDVAMSSATLSGFRRYMDTEIFLPLGIQAQTVPFGNNPAKYYRFDALTNGWALGDRSNFTGAGGYYISPVMYAKFLAYLNHSQSIIKTSTKDLMYANFLGWADSSTPENAPLGDYGRYYFKAGNFGCSTGSCTGQGVRNVIASFPKNDVEVVIMANSNGGSMDGSTALRNMLMSAYDNAWVESK